jgi:hypothetical protein
VVVIEVVSVVETVVEGLVRHALGPVVVDPVMVSANGDVLLRPDAVDAVVGHGERLGEPLRFVVNSAVPDGVHVPPVRLRLWMNLRVAVNLGRGSLEDAGSRALGQSQTMHRSEKGGLRGFDRIELIVRRGGRAREIVDLIHLELEGVTHIMPDKLKTGVPDEVLDVAFSAGEKVIEAENFVSFIEKAFAEVGT